MGKVRGITLVMSRPRMGTGTRQMTIKFQFQFQRENYPKIVLLYFIVRLTFNKHSNMKRIKDNNRMQNALRSFLLEFSLLMYKWVVSGHVLKLSFWIIHATWPHLVLV